MKRKPENVGVSHQAEGLLNYCGLESSFSNMKKEKDEELLTYVNMVKRTGWLMHQMGQPQWQY